GSAGLCPVKRLNRTVDSTKELELAAPRFPRAFCRPPAASPVQRVNVAQKWRATAAFRGHLTDPGLDTTDCIARGSYSQRGAVEATVKLCLPAVAQTGGDTVDAKMNRLHDALVALATAMAFEQLDLDVMQRVDIRKPVAY